MSGKLPARSVLSAAAQAMYDGFGGSTLFVAPDGLAAGTRVATPAGAVAVERLRAGDVVRAPGGGEAVVAWVTRRAVSAETLGFVEQLRPVRLRAHALGHMLPAAAVVMGPGQAVLVREVGQPAAVPAAALVNGVSVRWVRPRLGVAYYSVRLEGAQARSTALLAEGIGCLGGPVRADPEAVLRLRQTVAELAGMVPGTLAGNVARVDAHGAEGWVIDQDHPGVAVGVEMVAKGQVLGRALANLRRPDLEVAGLGACGFRLQLQQPLSPAENWLVQLRRIGDGAELPGSPVLIPRLPAPVDPAVLVAEMDGLVEAARGSPERLILARFFAERMSELVQTHVETPVYRRDESETESL